MGTDPIETGGTLAVAETAGDLLSHDNIPDENQSLTCFSCDTPMVGLYCHACGNKNDNYRRSVGSLVVEMLANLTAMDNRMWRTLWSLLRRPGQAARDFADGARSRWTSPVRFYLASSLLLFGYIALSGTQLVAFGERLGADDRMTPGMHTVENGQALHFFTRSSQLTLPGEGDAERLVGDIQRELAPQDGIEALEIAIASLDARIADAPSEAAAAALRETRAQIASELEAARAAEAAEADDDDRPDLVINNGRETMQLSVQDMSGIFGRIMRDPSIVNDGVNERLQLTMFFMLPFAMLMGAIFIRGRDKAMLYDHLVHAAYIHGASFLLLLTFILLHQFTPLPGLFWAYTALLLLYLPLSAKGMFGRGWFKSVLTAYGVGAVYATVVGVALIAFVALEFAEVARDFAETAPAAPAEPEPETPAPYTPTPQGD